MEMLHLTDVLHKKKFRLAAQLLCLLSRGLSLKELWKTETEGFLSSRCREPNFELKLALNMSKEAQLSSHNAWGHFLWHGWCCGVPMAVTYFPQGLCLSGYGYQLLLGRTLMTCVAAGFVALKMRQMTK